MFISEAECFIGTGRWYKTPHRLSGGLNPHRDVRLPGRKPLKPNIFFPPRQHYLISDSVPLSKKRGSNSTCFPPAVPALWEVRLISHFSSMIMAAGTLCEGEVGIWKISGSGTLSLDTPALSCYHYFYEKTGLSQKVLRPHPGRREGRGF